MSSSKLSSPVKFLLGALLLTLGILGWLSWNVYTSYTLLTTAIAQDVSLAELRGRLLHLDEVLTMSARMAALTGEPQWEQRYTTYVPQLNAALQETMLLVPLDISNQIRNETDAANTRLVELETTALAAVQQQRLAEARELLFSSDYEQQKQIYAQGMAKLLLYIERSSKERQYIADQQVQNVVISLAILLPVLFVVWGGVFRYLRATVSIREALLVAQVREQTLEQTGHAQEEIIAERTAALQEALHVVEAREAGLTETLSALEQSQIIIRRLSAPVIPVLPGVLVVPVIGILDPERLTVLRDNVLHAIEHHRSRVIIFDLTGVSIIDAQIARLLKDTAATVQLIGAQFVLVGIRPDVAEAIVGLHLDLTSIPIYPILQEAVQTLIRTPALHTLEAGSRTASRAHVRGPDKRNTT